SPMSPDPLDFLGESKNSSKDSKTTSKQTILKTTSQSESTAPAKINSVKVIDFTELDEEPQYKNGENTPIHPELQDDTLTELLLGLKYITTTLTKDGFEDTKTEMLKIINHAIQKARTDTKTQPKKNLNLASIPAPAPAPVATLPLSYAAIAAKQQQRE